MKRFFDKITPAFILKLEHQMLLNSPLAWQFQIPRILWFWFCITVAGSTIPFMMSLNLTSNNDDVETLILYTCVLGILQLFLYGYILIQFNATKNFVTRRWWHGLVEQLAYILIMMLCASQMVVYNFILDIRRSVFLPESQIMSEIAVFNKGRHYFMNDRENYRYFPDEKTFLTYMSKGGSTQDEYYYTVVRPAMEPYFTKDPSEMKMIDPSYTRFKKGPRLYFISEANYLKNKFFVGERRMFSSSYGSFIFGEGYTPYTFQLHTKTKAERLKEIGDFKNLMKKYGGFSYYGVNEKLIFDSDEQILEKYFSNQYQVCYDDENSDGYLDNISTYELENLYENVLRAKYVRWGVTTDLSVVTFFIAFPFALLLFIYKNTQLRPILIAIVFVILLGIVTGIITVIFRLKEDLLIHIPLIVFLISVFVMLSPYRTYKLWGSVMVVIGNVCFCAVPIYLFFYITEYLDMFKYNDYDQYDPALSSAREMVGWICFWGGMALYLLLGSTWYKRKYETIWAMPLSK